MAFDILVQDFEGQIYQNLHRTKEYRKLSMNNAKRQDRELGP
ncbi:hypothetical protein HMPREF1545_02630 [Oscillibacter sp. KLE 1728]|nr:hypothetical protein HMPREF1545_02630 [Oscillibacter sp. KLE 1728]